MNQLISEVIGGHKILDVIRARKNRDFNVETIRNALGISRTTADKFVNELLDKKIIEKGEKRYIIISEQISFLGISVGSKHTRIHLLNLNFDSLPLKEYLSEMKKFGVLTEESNEYGICFETPEAKDGHTFEAIRGLVSKVVGFFLAKVDAGFSLGGIGIAVTGPVNYDKAEWRSAPEKFTRVQNIALKELMGYDNFAKANELGIFLVLDNNAKTALISEYQYLLEQHNGDYDKDIALLYIGSGIGSSAVLGKSLLRGCQNLSGELGNLPAPPPYQSKTIDEVIRSFGPDATVDNYSDILTYLCNVINSVLGIDSVILVGHSIRKYQNIISKLLEKRMEYTVTSTQQYCEPTSGRGESGTAAIGAAIEAYMCMCHFNSTLPEERTNLAKDIHWL